MARTARDRRDSSSAGSTERGKQGVCLSSPRVVMGDVQPSIDRGCYDAKRVLGEQVERAAPHPLRGIRELLDRGAL